MDEFRFGFRFEVDANFQLVEDQLTWDLDFYFYLKFELKLKEGEFCIYVVLDNYEEEGFLKFMFINEV